MYRVEIFRDCALVFDFSAKIEKKADTGMYEEEYNLIENQAIELCQAKDVEFDSDEVIMLVDGHEYAKRTPEERDFDNLPLHEATHNYSGYTDEIEFINKYGRRAR